MARGGSSTFRLTATGTTEAILWPGPNSVKHHMQRNIQVGIWGVLDAGSNLTWHMEVSPDAAVSTSGGSWMTLSGWDVLKVSKMASISTYVAGIRAVVDAFTTGGLTIFVTFSL